jgi:peptide/nickel transport system substrate-binding protein
MQMYLQDNGWFSINDLFGVVNQYFSGDAYDAAPDPELTGWVKAAAATNDADERKALYTKVLTRIAEQVYILPMWTHPNVNAFSSDLDFTPYSDENPRFYLSRWKQ